MDYCFSFANTENYSLQDLKTVLFKNGLEINYSVDEDGQYLSVSGLESSQAKGIELLEEFIHKAEFSETALKGGLQNIKKDRETASNDKRSINRFISSCKIRCK